MDSVGRVNPVCSVVASSALVEIVSWGCPVIIEHDSFIANAKHAHFFFFLFLLRLQEFVF